MTELFKKTCHPTRPVMFFENFHKFLELLYVKKFDPERENLKRKVLAINFRLKKVEDESVRQELVQEKAVLS